MAASAVVEDLDAFQESGLRLLACSEPGSVHQLGLQEPKKLAIGTLSKQFPLRLMEGFVP